MRSRVIRPVGVVALATALTGCFNSAEPVSEIYGSTMGSTYSIKWIGSELSPEPAEVMSSVDALLEEFESVASTWRPTSELSRFNAAPAGTCQVMPQAILDIVVLAEDLHQKSEGRFDLTLAPLLRLWGFHGDGGSQKVPSEQQLAEAVALTGHEHLHVRDGQLCKDTALQIDINGIAAGYMVDQVVEHLADMGIKDYMVEITGELKADGNKPGGRPWRIAIEEPRDDSRVAQVILPLRGYSVSTSGDYRNYFEHEGHRYSHTFDPVTGKPVLHDLAAVTVLHPSAAWADGMSTVLLVMGSQSGWEYAVKHELPVLFVIRKGDGFVSRSTPQFIALQKSKE